MWGGELRVGLIKRKAHPYLGRYAFPGGFVGQGETAKDAIVREVKEEMGLDLAVGKIRTLDTYDTPNRDPRTWVVSKAHLVLLPPNASWKLTAGDDASKAVWATVGIETQTVSYNGQVLTLAFDHQTMLEDAIERLKGWITWNFVPMELLGDTFTINQAVEVLHLLGISKARKETFMRQYKHLVDVVGLVQTGKRPAKVLKLKG